jgi:hypothetical protein
MIISDAELAPFVSANDPASRAHGLLQQQRGSWELLRKGYESLQSVRTKVFEFDGFQIKVQFNPGRMTSTVAKVDARSIQERKCFLCTQNLPPVQRGIPCDGNSVVLCNPFPIFPEHFTISCLDHAPQRIRDTFGAFLQLTRDLGSRYALLYNGPKCGASAPDHLHFQAGNRSFLPIDAEYAAITKREGRPLVASGSFRAYSVENYLRYFISFESADAGRLTRAFGELYAVLNTGGGSGEEPMLNVLGLYDDGEWKIIVFPRAKHRPVCYFKEGDDQLLISPAAVELGGICTTPRERDFERVTRDNIADIYREITVSPDRFDAIKAALAARLAALG